MNTNIKCHFNMQLYMYLKGTDYEGSIMLIYYDADW